MITFADYIKVGRLQQMAERGWLKITLKGKTIMIIFLENDPLAVEISDSANPESLSLPEEFHPESADEFLPLIDPPMESWGYLKTYPVKIEDDDIFIGINPLE
jgi:hypothetical protein